MIRSLRSRQDAFFEALQRQVLVADGAMGTMIYARGIPFSASFDELNLSNPELVGSIHREYLQAGAQIIETNTFGANRVRLAPHALGEKVRDINYAGARLAREICRDKAWVFGSIGPLGKPLKPVGVITLEEARTCFQEQIEALLEGGVDFILLETFTDLREILQAVIAARQLGDIPIFAQMTFTEDLKTVMGDKPEEIVTTLVAQGARMIGVNCSSGPQGIYEVMEIIAASPKTKNVYLSAMPNAGMPRLIGGRYMYLSSPEYMADYAVRFVDLGIQVVGGCCGTTPAHIRLIAERVKGLRPVSRTLRGKKVAGTREAPPPAEIPLKAAPPTSFAERLGKEFLASVEIDPPRGVDTTRLIEGAIFLKSKGVEFINVADSPLARARMSPLVLAQLIRDATGMEIILHLSCRDRNLLGLQAELMGAHALGIRNILAITGDPPKLGDYPTATGVYDVDSIGLVKIISNLNTGVDLMGRKVGTPTNFAAGVGINPVAIDMEREIDRLGQKIAAGAQFAFTQPIYDLKILENLIKLVDHFHLPVFVGILPLRNAKHAEFLHNEIPEMFIPDIIRKRMANSGEKGPEEGVKIAREFLKKAREMVQGVYLMPPFNRFEMATQVLEVLQ